MWDSEIQVYVALSELVFKSCTYCFVHLPSVAFRDTPRKRGGAVSGSSSLARCATPAAGVSAEPQLEEAVDENFPVRSPYLNCSFFKGAF